MSNFRKILLGAVAGVAALSAVEARADVIDFDFQLGTSAQQGSLPMPAGSIEITQIGLNQVGFVLKNTIDGPYDGNLFLSTFLLNYTGGLALTAQQWAGAPAPAGFSLQAFNTGTFSTHNGATAGYSGFDIELSFPTSNNQNSDRFKDHEYYAWMYTGNGLQVADFTTGIVPTDGDSPTSPVMIHVQGISGDTNSFWIVDPPTNVPEPTSFALAGVALAGIGLARRRTKRA